MIQIRTTIGCDLEYLDTYGDEDIKIEVSFAEVQDITKKNSTFTKSFKLPGSKHNNDIFNHFYDFSASMYDYDARRKFDCQILLDGNILYEGYLRLNSATNDNNEIIYDVGFYSEVGNLVANIGDKLLADIDFSNLNHPYDNDIGKSYFTDNTFLNPLDPTVASNPYLNGSIYYALVHKGYSYSGNTVDDTNISYTDTPILDWAFDSSFNIPQSIYGYWNAALTPVQFFYLTPSIQIKEVYERIFTGAGYNIQSEFMDTDYFKNFYLPLTFDDDSIFPNSTIDPRFAFAQQGMPPSGEISGLTNYTWTENFQQPPATSSSTRIPAVYVSQDNFQATLSTQAFQVSTAGQYSFRISFNAYNSELFPETVPLDAVGQFFIRNSAPNGTTGGTLTFNSGLTVYTSPTYIIPEGQSYGSTISGTFTKYGNDTQAFALDVDKFDGVGEFILTYFKFEITGGPRQMPGGVIDIRKEFPCCQYKQMEFVASINQFFNMVTVPIPNDPKTLRVEPVIDFIGKGETLDWTSKVDRDEPITVEPLTDIIEGTLNYSYEEDDSWANETFMKANNYVFGDRNVELQQDYKDKSTDFETEFGAQVDRVINIVSGNTKDFTRNEFATMPVYFQRKDRDGADGGVIPEFNPYRTTQKLLFKGFNLPAITIGAALGSGSTGFVLNFNLVGFNNIQTYRGQNRFTTYPFGINKFSHYTTWSDDTFDKQELTFPGAETMYDVYWGDYIDDLTNPDNRLVSMKMYFDPFEVSQLNFNEVINVDNTKFRINSIKNYSLTERGLADVELIKLTKEYEPHRKLYYTATPCDSSECPILYSHSDLQYNLFAYTNKYAYIEGCGCMYLTYSYDPPVGNVDYQYILIEKKFNGNFYTIQNNYRIYNSCEDCENDDNLIEGNFLNVTNNIVPEPTPTPSSTPCATQTPRPSSPLPSYSPLPITPTPTPTPSSTSIPTDPCTCIEYEIYNSSPSQVGNYKYKRCIDNVVIGPTYIQPLETQYVCACENSIKSTVGIQTTGVGFCLSPIDPTPTPTPSVTATNTPTPTHTPTPTPTFGGGTPTDYDVCNTSGLVDITVAYVECATGNLISVVIPAGECAEACACSDIAFIGPAGSETSMAVLNNGDCVYVCDRGSFRYNVTSGGASDFIIQTRQTTYSGGTLTGAYYDGPSWLFANDADKNDYNNYVRNTPLNGGLYQVYEGGDAQGTGGFSQTFWSNTDDSWIVRQTQDDSGLNPIYFQGLQVSQSDVNYVSQNATGSTIYQGNFYPPNSGITFNNADNPPGTPADYFEYDDPCIQPGPTPTPTQYGGTPTPTPSNTATNTPTPTPTPTPSTSGVPATCTLYQITNNSFMSTTYKFKTCPDGIPQLETLGPLQEVQVCAITGSVVLASGSSATIGILGDCT